MKLTSLLLSSAAVLVAGSAFAADLPAKKAAPAAAVTACPAFGAGFFTIPGSDTCIKLGGYMNNVTTYSDEDQSTSNAAELRLTLDARSNSEIGVIRGFGRIGNGGMERAYVQVGGLTVGKNSSLADISGTNAWNYGANLGGGSKVGATYAATMGAVTLSLGIAESANNNFETTSTSTLVGTNTTWTKTTTTTNTSGTPDLLVGISAKTGPVDVKLVGVSHTAVDGTGETQGYAVVGRIGASVGGGFGVALFGGISEAAAAYTGDIYTDTDGGGNSNTGTNIGGEITLEAGNGTLALAADQYTASLAGADATVTTYGISYAYNVAKGLAVEPELVYTSEDDDGTTTESTTVYLRIQRDF
jgi:hypothetical protein